MYLKKSKLKIGAFIVLQFCNFTIFAQGPQATRSSMSSSLHSGEIPVNMYTGIPEISIPIYEMGSHSKDIGANLSLNYHPSGLSIHDQPGDMGRGWNLNGLGIISRTVLYRPDEFFTTLSNLENDYDSFFDIYQYNFMGHGGRFRILKNNETNTFSLQMMDPTTLKIEYQFHPQNKSIDKFTIYDDKGYRFVFDIFDVNISNFPGNGTNTILTMPYRSSFYLSKIYDNTGNVVVSYNYSSVTVPYLIGSLTSSMDHYKTFHKLQEIITTDVGKATFDYSYQQPLGNNNTPYNPFITAINIKTTSGELIKKIGFTYSGEVLKKVSDYGKSLTNSKDYKIFYNNQMRLRTLENPYGYSGTGWPEKIVLPTGGSILYDFEWNTHAYAISPGFPATQHDDEYLQYNPENAVVLDYYDSNEFNTALSRTWNFTIEGNEPEKFHFFFDHQPYNYPPNQQISDEPLPIHYKIMSGSTIVHDFNSSEGIVTLSPGNYTIHISTVSNLNTTGYITVSKEQPQGHLKRWFYTSGFRIKRIAKFDTDVHINYLYDPSGFSISPAQDTYYEYSMFDDPNKSSGTFYMGYGISWAPYLEVASQTGYSNIKVYNRPQNGYAKYTFAIPTFFIDDDHYFSFKQGMLKKAEIYDNDGQLLSTTENEYTLVSSGDYFPVFNTVSDQNIDTKLSWTQLTSKKSVEKLGNNDVIATQTFTYNNTNKKIASKSSTTSLSGETLKTIYTYHTGNSPFSTNRIGMPEKTESFSNSTLLFSEKIDYSNAWNGNQSYLPLSISSSKGNGLLEVKSKFSLYDEFGNMLQSEQENGMKTCYIWGYSKTQTVAKIENMDYASIPANLITAIQTATNSGTEASVLTALDALRNSTALSNAMITTYTYKSLIGISTATDPKGDRLSYYYDNFGELVSIRNKDGNIVSEKTTFYKNQN